MADYASGVEASHGDSGVWGISFYRSMGDEKSCRPAIHSIRDCCDPLVSVSNQPRPEQLHPLRRRNVKIDPGRPPRPSIDLGRVAGSHVERLSRMQLQLSQVFEIERSLPAFRRHPHCSEGDHDGDNRGDRPHGPRSPLVGD